MLPTSVDLDRLQTVCERYGIERLDVFGSTARGSASPNSDIDLLYTLVPGARLGWNIEALNVELTELLGRPVDLVSADGLNPRLRDHILSEARPFYAAA